jgi:peptide deformylase|tara:strand:+ start:3645 stop:4376 length:732 start_codon:yes stop_codon:yes gene_type:complete
MGSTQKNVMKKPKQNMTKISARDNKQSPKYEEKVKEEVTETVVEPKHKDYSKTKTYSLIPPRDPRIQSAIAPFSDDMLKEHGLKDRKELAEQMFATMRKYGGIGLTCNQVGLPFNMFVIGDHPHIEDGLKMACFNPMIITQGEEKVVMKEGCLTFPFVFLSITRPRKVIVKYEDEDGKLQEGHLDGMISRVFQHEHEHTLGRNFTEGQSKMKLDLAYKKAGKQMKAYEKHKKAMEKVDNRMIP